MCEWVCIDICVSFFKFYRKGTIIEKCFSPLFWGYLSILAHKSLLYSFFFPFFFFFFFSFLFFFFSLPYSFNTCVVVNQDVLCNWAVCVLHIDTQVKGWRSACQYSWLAAPSHKGPLFTLFWLWRPTPCHPSGWYPLFCSITDISQRLPLCGVAPLPFASPDSPHSRPCAFPPGRCFSSPCSRALVTCPAIVASGREACLTLFHFMTLS